MSELDDITTEISPSAVPLSRTEEQVPTMKHSNSKDREVYKFYGGDAEHSYKKGTVIRINQEVPASTVLNHIISLYIDTVRNQLEAAEKSEEARKELLVELNRVHNGLTALTCMLNKDDFKLDINSIIHIIHGYVNTNVEQIFENYETRRRTTHRHDS